jgi:hypothetical protein
MLPLYELVNERDFPDLDKEVVKKSMQDGLKSYCARNNYTKLANDPPFPKPAIARIYET